MFVIVGTGALASLFAARLARCTSGPLWMLGTWAEAVAAINTTGIVVETGSGAETVRVKATADPDQCSGAEAAIVLVKSWQTGRAARQITSFLAPSGVALTLQNGLGNLETLGAELGVERTALGITMQGATLLGPGRVREGGRGPIHLADHPRLGSVVALLRDGGFEVHLAPDVTPLIWGKLVVNAAINALTALLRVTNGELLNRPSALALADEAAREVAAVAAAKNITLPFSDPVLRAHEVMRLTAHNRSSMLQDVLRNAPTEVEAINGAVVREAHVLNVSTPVNEMLWRLVTALAQEHST
ncbi:MAG: ketopantoate reductase family protein [Chloroflexi bacterium]|nr:ketopantoate reductase family protein [Chloroflexota bacterium]